MTSIISLKPEFNHYRLNKILNQSMKMLCLKCEFGKCVCKIYFDKYSRHDYFYGINLPQYI